ncbi:Transcriptional regulator, Lrp/AsnC family [Thermoproteus tenax Kra 1]|uniref:Transcriptional regulator, Lrp/AsnC family n=1 Tax=Thermoproteus tenax (strain ATCC 35583 / DSM 2078 / JCM 9277 / NBRC 100435 / Kra 1) TaxID=768679 RepID=G4RQ72_THETK|nr:Transcriptional regulator, Lrp/AsnC family [Thermoproteus tenax Kra 1]
MCAIDEKDLEVLRAAFKGGGRFYAIYRQSNLSLATAWRRTKKLIKLGYLRERGDLIEPTEKALVVLAHHGEVGALVQLAHKYDVDKRTLASFIKEVCKRVGSLDYVIAERLPELLKVFNFVDLYDFVDTELEPVVAKLYLEYCAPCVVRVDGNAFLFGDGYVLAAYCRLCDKGGQYVLFHKCPYAERFFSQMKKEFINAEARDSHEAKQERLSKGELLGGRAVGAQLEHSSESGGGDHKTRRCGSSLA